MLGIFPAAGDCGGSTYEPRNIKVKPRNFDFKPTNREIKPRNFRVKPTNYEVKPGNPEKRRLNAWLSRPIVHGQGNCQVIPRWGRPGDRRSKAS